MPTQSPTRGPLILGVLITTVGVGWLLSAQGIGPDINWVWTLGLGVLGVLSFIVSGGVDKASVIIGPMLLAASTCSVFRQTGRLDWNTEVPLLVIGLGVLILVAQSSIIPAPKWFQPDEPQPRHQA